MYLVLVRDASKLWHIKLILSNTKSYSSLVRICKCKWGDRLVEFIRFLCILFRNKLLQSLKGLKNIKRALLYQHSGIFVEKARYLMFTRMLWMWLRLIPNVKAQGLSHPSQKLRTVNGVMTYVLWYSVSISSASGVRGKESGCSPVFAEGRLLWDSISRKAGLRMLLSARLIGEVICCCSAYDGNTCLLGTELCLRSSWPRTSDNMAKGTWQLLYLKFNQWPKGETPFYNVTLNLDGWSCLCLHSDHVLLFCNVTQEEELFFQKLISQ